MAKVDKLFSHLMGIFIKKQAKQNEESGPVCVCVSELERTNLDMYVPLQSAERRNLSTLSHFAQQLNRVRPLRGGESVRYARSETERAIRDSRGRRSAAADSEARRPVRRRAAVPPHTQWTRPGGCPGPGPGHWVIWALEVQVHHHNRPRGGLDPWKDACQRADGLRGPP